MLSMRNGISLHPMCLPGIQQPLQLSHARVGYGEETASQHMNTTSFVSLDGETSAQTVFRPPNQCTSLDELSIPNASNIIRSETSFGLESSISAHFGPFPFRTCSEVSLDIFLMSSTAYVERSDYNLTCIQCKGNLQG